MLGTRCIFGAGETEGEGLLLVNLGDTDQGCEPPSLAGVELHTCNLHHFLSLAGLPNFFLSKQIFQAPQVSLIHSGQLLHGMMASGSEKSSRDDYDVDGFGFN